jgi:hypothetical protein
MNLNRKAKPSRLREGRASGTGRAFTGHGIVLTDLLSNWYFIEQHCDYADNAGCNILLRPRPSTTSCAKSSVSHNSHKSLMAGFLFSFFALS